MLVLRHIDPYHAPMLRTDLALREAEPDSVGWLQSQIRNRLAKADLPAPNPDLTEDDEY